MIERVPPHDLDAEQSVLAACLTDATAVTEIQATGIIPEHCYHGHNATILASVFALVAAGHPVDVLTVRNHLAGNLDAAGGHGYLVDLASSIPTTAHAPYYAGIVVEKARRREAIKALSQSLAECFDTSAEDPIGAAQARIMGLDSAARRASTLDFGEVVSRAYGPIWDRLNGGVEARAPRVFETGLYDLDRLAWFEPGEMAILGARPSHGKTALALQMMLAAAHSGVRVLFHSLEMQGRQIALRYLAAMSGASTYRLRQGFATLEQRGKLTNAVSAALDLPIRLDETPDATVAEIAANLRREMLRHPVGLLVVDHLLEVKPADPRGARHAQMSQIGRDLRTLGKQTGVMVLGLYQLNRSAANENRKPRISDLRESGTIEEVADHVHLLYRPDHESKADITEAEVLVEKNRNGATGTVSLTYDGPRMTFACREHHTEVA